MLKKQNRLFSILRVETHDMRVNSTIILFLTFFFSKVFKRLVLGWHPPINLFNAWYSRRAVGWLWVSMFYQSLGKKGTMFDSDFLSCFLREVPSFIVFNCISSWLVCRFPYLSKFQRTLLIGSVVSEELQGIWPVSFDLLSWNVSTCFREIRMFPFSFSWQVVMELGSSSADSFSR